jgi:hypothetical protein
MLDTGAAKTDEINMMPLNILYYLTTKSAVTWDLVSI